MDIFRRAFREIQTANQIDDKPSDAIKAACGLALFENWISP